MKKTDDTSNSRYGQACCRSTWAVVHAALNIQHVRSHLCFMYGLGISAAERIENVILQKGAKGMTDTTVARMGCSLPQSSLQTQHCG